MYIKLSWKWKNYLITLRNRWTLTCALAYLNQQAFLDKIIDEYFTPLPGKRFVILSPELIPQTHVWILHWGSEGLSSHTRTKSAFFSSALLFCEGKTFMCLLILITDVTCCTNESISASSITESLTSPWSPQSMMVSTQHRWLCNSLRHPHHNSQLLTDQKSVSLDTHSNSLFNPQHQLIVTLNSCEQKVTAYSPLTALCTPPRPRSWLESDSVYWA